MADDDLIRGPKWRTRAAPDRRAAAALTTGALVVIAGSAVMALIIWLLHTLGAPGWLALMPWWLPAVGTTAWTLRGPAAAVATDDDDDSWAMYAVRFLLVGADQPRPAPVRVIAALLVGAPVCWVLAVFGILTLVGVF